MHRYLAMVGTGKKTSRYACLWNSTQINNRCIEFCFVIEATLELKNQKPNCISKNCNSQLLKNSHVESVNLSEYSEVVSFGVASYDTGITSLVLWLQRIVGACAYLL